MCSAPYIASWQIRLGAARFRADHHHATRYREQGHPRRRCRGGGHERVLPGLGGTYDAVFYILPEMTMGEYVRWIATRLAKLNITARRTAVGPAG